MKPRSLSAAFTDSSTAPAWTRALIASASMEITRLILRRSTAMPGLIVSAPPMRAGPAAVGNERRPGLVRDRDDLAHLRGRVGHGDAKRQRGFGLVARVEPRLAGGVPRGFIQAPGG